MSTSVIDFTNQKRRRRSEYSKKGCRECKRRKIKCDEGKPSCWQCERLRKNCTYPEEGERVLRVSRKSMKTDSPNIKSEYEFGSESNDDHYTNSSTSSQSLKHKSSSDQVQPTSQHYPSYGHNQVDYQQVPHEIQTTSHQTRLPNTLGSGFHPPYGHHQQQLPQQLHQQLQYLGTPLHSRIPPIIPQSASSPPFNSDPNSRNVLIHGSYSNSKFTSSISNLLNDTKSPAIDTSLQTKKNLSSSSSGPASINNMSNLSPDTMSTNTQDSPNPTSFNTPHYADSQNQSNGQHVQLTNSSSSMGNDSIILLSSDNYQFFNQEDLNLLASDLNNIVTDIMFESNFDTKFNNKILNSDSMSKPSSNDGISSAKTSLAGTPPNVAPTNIHQNNYKKNDSIPRNIPFSYIKVHKTHEKLYLEEFYNEFSNVILPFKSYDESLKCYFNPARDILLKCASNESFLLAAILAQGAKSSFNKNNLPEDEEAYCSYLSKCLKLLGPALDGGSSTISTKSKNLLTSNIEAVLLTVLLLTSSNASNTNQNWRPHLRGAKDLLLKNTSSKTKFKNSKILVFCKFWYISIEILAGLSSNLGGTLKTDSEIESLITCGDKYEIKNLKESGLILNNGFNLITGYHNDCVIYLRDLIKILNELRGHEKPLNPNNSFEYIRLLSEFYKQSKIEFVNKKGILKLSDFKDGTVPEGGLLDVTTVQGETIIISWMDLSHQSYVLASLITILTKCFQLPHSSPQVQSLTTDLITLLSFLGKTSETPQLIKCSIMMIQWPMLVAGMNCIQEDHKFLIMKFFRAAARIGSGSAGFALRKINKIWSIHENGAKYSEGEDEANIDIVSY